MQIRFCLLLAALCACFGLGASLTTSKPVTIDLLASKEAAEVVTTANSDTTKDELFPVNPVIIPNTTSTTTSTKAPTTTSTKAPTTTTSTKAPTTTTSTKAPTTTTSTKAPTTTPTPTPKPKPTPAPAPTPVPAPTQGKWWYKDEKNITCVVIQFAAQLKVTYAIVNTTNLTSTVVLNVPKNASVVSGSCEGDEQFIKLSWPVENSTVTNDMEITFLKNDTTKMYGIKSLEFALSPAVFVNATSNTVVNLTHGSDWSSPLSTSYRCAVASDLKLSAASGAVATLTLTQLQEEAFRTHNSTDFSAARECNGSDVPDAVPIAVGCALGGLVVVVLIAYLIARRNSAARGYVSM